MPERGDGSPLSERASLAVLRRGATRRSVQLASLSVWKLNGRLLGLGCDFYGRGHNDAGQISL